MTLLNSVLVGKLSIKKAESYYSRYPRIYDGKFNWAIGEGLVGGLKGGDGGLISFSVSS